MTEDFTGKVALVTGGGSGIGAATCRAFAAAGAQGAILDRNVSAAEAVAAEITGRNGHAAAYGLDVVGREAFARLTEGITEAWGGIDILVNGAGTTVRRMIGEMGAEDWDRVIAVNLTGAWRYCRICGRAAAAPSSISPRSPGSASRLAAPRIIRRRKRAFSV